MELGEFIRERRKKLGVSQDILARKSGLAQTIISKIERGEFLIEKLDEVTWRRMALVLKVSPKSLLGRVSRVHRGHDSQIEVQRPVQAKKSRGR